MNYCQQSQEVYIYSYLPYSRGRPPTLPSPVPTPLLNVVSWEQCLDVIFSRLKRCLTTRAFSENTKLPFRKKAYKTNIGICLFELSSNLIAHTCCGAILTSLQMARTQFLTIRCMPENRKQSDCCMQLETSILGLRLGQLRSDFCSRCEIATERLCARW